MADFDWKSAIGKFAPIIGSALGTPVVGMAVATISNAIFGKPDATADEISSAVSSGLSGDQIVALKQAEIEFKLKMSQMDIDILKLGNESDKMYLEDVADARQRQIATKDHMPQIIFAAMMSVFVLLNLLLYFGPVVKDEFAKALVVKSFSIVEIALIGAVQYFIGSSKGSKVSGDAIRKIAEKA